MSHSPSHYSPTFATHRTVTRIHLLSIKNIWSIWAKISTNSPIKYSQFLSTSRSTNKSKSIIIIISDFIEATQQTVNWIFRHPLNHHNESVIIDFHLSSYLPQSRCLFSPSSCSSWATASAPRPEAEILTGTASGTWRGWRGRASPSAATSRRQVRICCVFLLISPQKHRRSMIDNFVLTFFIQ